MKKKTMICRKLFSIMYVYIQMITSVFNHLQYHYPIPSSSVYIANFIVISELSKYIHKLTTAYTYFKLFVGDWKVTLSIISIVTLT